MKRCTDCVSIANRPQANLQVSCETDGAGTRMDSAREQGDAGDYGSTPVQCLDHSPATRTRRSSHMRVKLQLVMCSDEGQEETVTEVMTLNKNSHRIEHLGLTMAEAKQLLSTLQQHLLQHQVDTFLDRCATCADCGALRKVKAHASRSFRTLFGTYKLYSPRLEHCDCIRRKTASFRPLSALLTESVAPELLYMEAKWSSLVSYGMAWMRSRTFSLLRSHWMSRPCGMTPSRWPSVWKPSWVTSNHALSKAVPASGTSCLFLMGHSRWALTGGTCATGSRSSTTSKSLWARVRVPVEKMKQTRRPPANALVLCKRWIPNRNDAYSYSRPSMRIFASHCTPSVPYVPVVLLLRVLLQIILSCPLFEPFSQNSIFVYP